MPLQEKEKAVLRNLAKQYMEIAVLPIQKEKKLLWQELNRLNMQRPMINIDQIPWHEMDVDGLLVNQVEDPYWRMVETGLRQAIYRFRHMPVDMVVQPYITIPRPIEYTGYGLQVEQETASWDAKNDVVGHKYINTIKDEEDIAKIQVPKAILHKEAERQIRQEAEALFQGIAPFHMAGLTLHLGLWDFITLWMGVETIYIELLDRPEFMHAIMERLTDCTEKSILQMNEDGLFDAYTNICHCSYTYVDDLPAAGCDMDNPRSQDVWAFGLAQLFSSVSPKITEEFEVPYMQRIFRHFGAIYYGCCDRLDDRLDVVSKMPNIRKISCSPWSDRENFAEKLPRQYIMSNKPNPALVGGTSMDYDAVRKDLRRTMDAAKSQGKCLELILKDISTVQYQPQRLWEWSKIALEEACR